MGVKKIFRGLAKVAPIAAAAMSGGVLGPVAAGVAKQVGDALGKPGASPEEIEAAVAQASPEQLVALRKINADLESEHAELAYKRDELVYKDRASARRREIAVQDSTPRVLTYITFALFGILCFALLKFEVPEHSRMLLGGLVGILGGEVARQGAYFFGSSQGSKSKDDHIRAALESQQTRR